MSAKERKRMLVFDRVREGQLNLVEAVGVKAQKVTMWYSIMLRMKNEFVGVPSASPSVAEIEKPPS